MASAITHVFASTTLGLAITPGRIEPRVLIAGAVCSAIPDADVIGFNLGVPYHDMFGHRGFSHSIFFAVALSLFMTWALFGAERWRASRKRILGYLLIITLSHGFFDAMTDGGHGVAFFAPFTDARYFFPFRNVAVSPLSIGSFFTARGIEIMKSEVFWIWLPWLVVSAATYAVFWKQDQRREAPA